MPGFSTQQLMLPQTERTPSTAARCNETSHHWLAAVVPTPPTTTPLIIQDIMFQRQGTNSEDLQPNLGGRRFEYL